MAEEGEGAAPQEAPVIQHVLAPSYIYLMPAGFVFFHDVASARVGLTYYHDEMRVMAERWRGDANSLEYATQPVRVQDATVVLTERNYLRTLRETLDSISQAKPGLIEEYGISLGSPKEQE